MLAWDPWSRSGRKDARPCWLDVGRWVTAAPVAHGRGAGRRSPSESASLFSWASGPRSPEPSRTRSGPPPAPFLSLGSPVQINHKVDQRRAGIANTSPGSSISMRPCRPLSNAASERAAPRVTPMSRCLPNRPLSLAGPSPPFTPPPRTVHGECRGDGPRWSDEPRLAPSWTPLRHDHLPSGANAAASSNKRVQNRTREIWVRFTGAIHETTEKSLTKRTGRQR